MTDIRLITTKKKPVLNSDISNKEKKFYFEHWIVLLIFLCVSTILTLKILYCSWNKESCRNVLAFTVPQVTYDDSLCR